MPHYYDLDVSLDGIQPRVWRRFLIAADATFAELHLAIQDAGGWWNYHLYEFSDVDGTPLAGLPDDEWADGEPVPDATFTRLAAHFGAHDRCRYVYDFGDHWEHTVGRVAVVELPERFHRRLVDGARAFPREDCGGVGGYEHCVDVARGGEDPDGLREWLDGWDPEAFDLEQARATFDRDQPPATAASPFAAPGFPMPAATALGLTDVQPREELAAAAAGNLLLGRLGTFTRWVGEGRKLTGTGNLTRADGRELIGVLDTADRFDEQIGDRVFKTKSTTELREVDHSFRLARSAGFVKVRKGTVSVTKRGSAVGRDPLADWHAAFAGLLRLGILGHTYAHATWIDPYWKDVVDEHVPGMLAHLAVAKRPVGIAELHERFWGLVQATFVVDDLTAEQLERHRDHLEGDVRRICEALADLGAVTVSAVEVVTTIHGGQRKHGGQVELTPLGEAGVRRLVPQ